MNKKFKSTVIMLFVIIMMPMDIAAYSFMANGIPSDNKY